MTLIERLRGRLPHNCSGCFTDTMEEAAEALSRLTDPRPLSEYHEDMGPVLWWRFPVEEPPYVGSPLDTGRPVKVTIRDSVRDKTYTQPIGGWPGYHTHFTPLPPIPSPPSEDKP